MMNRDSFEMHKGNKIYPLVAEVDVVNSKPLFVRDDLGLFSGVYFEDDTLSLVWLKKEFILKDIEFLRAVFFVNKVPIEEHIFTIPHNQEGTAWWSHPYMEKMRGKMSIKFYGC